MLYLYPSSVIYLAPENLGFSTAPCQMMYLLNLSSWMENITQPGYIKTYEIFNK